MPDSPKHQLKLSLDYRFIIVLLVIVIIAMLGIWRPWSVVNSSTRTVTATGTATIKATPDEFDFNTTYEFKNAGKDAALAELTAKSNSVVAALKSLGVPDNQIKTSSNGSAGGYYILTPGGQPTYTLTLSLTLNDKTLVQKVQDYLVTTSPSGGLSPQPVFSASKQKTLNAQARDEAAKDAKTNALQMAKTLGYHLGAVKSVSDGQNSGIVPVELDGTVSSSSGGGKAILPTLAVQPGENDVNYSVTVTYFIR